MRALLKKARDRAAATLVPAPRDAAPTPLETAYLRRVDALFTHQRANGVTAGRDVLALAATRGRCRLATLEDALRRMGHGWAARTMLTGLDREPYLKLATLLAEASEDHADAVLLLQAMADRLGPRAIRKQGRFRLLELLVEAGATDDLPTLLERHTIARENPAQAHLLRANAANAFRSGSASPADEDAWVRAINAMYAAEGLEGISLAPGDAAPFDRVTAHAEPSASGPLVTVIIPTYDPGPRLATAVESLLAQSHRELQILIMDDASPAASAAALDRWPERDPRIEIVHLPENNGPYFARNVAASRHARGAYVTIHDDDDWSHPRKIELQVAQLEAEPGVSANMSHSVRASDDLWLGRVNGDPVWTQQGLNTLMVRREVFDAIGYWDVLNRSADAEFNDRIRAWTQARIPTIGRVPLTLYRIRWDSLSAGEFHRGYMDPRRRWYYQSYLHWHESCLARGETPHLPADDRESRPFSVPRDLTGSRGERAAEALEVELLVAGDFRVAAADGLADELETALSAGRRVAVLQLDSPAVAPGTRVRPRILEVAMRAHVVGPMDRVAARTAVVTDPSSLQFARTDRSALSAERVVMMDRAGHAVAADERLFETAEVEAAAEALFGRAPEVVDAGPLSAFA